MGETGQLSTPVLPSKDHLGVQQRIQNLDAICLNRSDLHFLTTTGTQSLGSQAVMNLVASHSSFTTTWGFDRWGLSLGARTDPHGVMGESTRDLRVPLSCKVGPRLTPLAASQALEAGASTLRMEYLTHIRDRIKAGLRVRIRHAPPRPAMPMEDLENR